MSHLEMAESVGWIKGNNERKFLDNNPRGFYLKKENIVHFYKGQAFEFDEELEKSVFKILPELVVSLKLNDLTTVYLGPKDKVIKGKEFKIKYLGTIEKITGSQE